MALTTGLPQQLEPAAVVNDLPNYEPLRGSELQQRANYVKEMAKHAFAGYVKHTQQSSRKEPSKGWFGKDHDRNMIASMSTLYVMDLDTELEQALQWVRARFEPIMTDDVIVSHAVGDIIGGLLSVYALTGERVCLEKAQLVADSLEGAYLRSNVKKSRISTFKLHPKDGTADGFQVTLTDGVHGLLEYTYLTDLTGDLEYKQRAVKARADLDKFEHVVEGNIPTDTVNLHLNKFWSTKFHLHRSMQSYFTDPIKAHIQSGGTDTQSLKRYIAATDLMLKHQLISASEMGLMYPRHLNCFTYKHDDFMDQEATSFGALLALGAKAIADVMGKQDRDSIEEYEERARVHWTLAEALTETSYQAHHRSPIKLSPRRVFFNDKFHCENGKKGPFYKQYLLTPEYAESLFIMWRMTHNLKWREYAWKLAQKIKEHCYTPSGFAGIDQIDKAALKRFSYQPTHLLSATFKYLYLIFMEDNIVSLDKWVFNDFGHPLPIKGTVPAYPAEKTQAK